jgi:hypothetical protein
MASDLDDRPITLKEACHGFKFKPATLRAAASAGRLTIFKLGRQYHTTRPDITKWIELCRADALRPAFSARLARKSKFYRHQSTMNVY